MVLAMMPPLLVDQISHLWTRSLKRRRVRAILLFSAAYLFLWSVASWSLVVVSHALVDTLVASSSLGPIAVTLAAIWQLTPAKQATLNHCHRLPSLPAFGIAADMSAVHYGLTTGGWCVASCWALMLIPTAIHGVGLMATTMIVMLVERQAPCRGARWRFSLVGDRSHSGDHGRGETRRVAN
jgi:predicted metal-binding membrane protein